MRLGYKSLSTIIFATATVSACAPPPKPLPPPPPVVILPPPPAMPLPPGGAAATTVIPPIGVDGVRMTPNRGLSMDEVNEIEHVNQRQHAQHIPGITLCFRRCCGLGFDRLFTVQCHSPSRALARGGRTKAQAGGSRLHFGTIAMSGFA